MVQQAFAVTNGLISALESELIRLEANINARAAAEIERARERSDWFKALAMQFVDTGIGCASQVWIDRFDFHNGSNKTDKRLRALAKALDRPYLMAISHGPGYYKRMRYDRRTVHFRVPKQSRLKGLVAPLLILAEEREYGPRSAIGAGAGAVTRCDTPGMWNFYFHENEGVSIFKEFHTRAHTDPVTRTILKL